MTAFPVHIKEVMHLYEKGLKLKPPIILRKDNSEPQDVVNISAEAKRKQVLEQLKKTVVERIKTSY